jgi:hypothetical protein
MHHSVPARYCPQIFTSQKKLICGQCAVGIAWRITHLNYGHTSQYYTIAKNLPHQNSLAYFAKPKDFKTRKKCEGEALQLILAHH